MNEGIEVRTWTDRRIMTCVKVFPHEHNDSDRKGLVEKKAVRLLGGSA